MAAIVDTNASPKGIDYVVPGNDDAISAIRFYCKTLADVIIESRRIILEEDAAAIKAKAAKAKQKPNVSEGAVIKKAKSKAKPSPTIEEKSATEVDPAIESEKKPATEVKEKLVAKKKVAAKKK